MKNKEFEMLAKTFKGLEQVLAAELVQLGANNVQVERRAVSFTGDKRMLYTANMCLRTASRVLVPILSFKAQKADDIYEKVKALDWSPMRLGYLLSGGGAEDKTIKLWNINTMLLVDSVYTSSQVCNLAFSKNSNEFVSTHGYADNYILVWDFAKMDIKATLKGLKARVVYMSVGPDNERIVTGSGDETLRFWKVFNQNIKKNKYDDGREELFDITNNSNVVR